MTVIEKDTLNFNEVSKLLEKGIVLIPLISAIAYLASYFFEVAFLSVYNIPSQLAEIKIENFVFIFLASSFISVMISIIYTEHREENISIKNVRKKPEVAVLLLVSLLLLFLALPFYFTLNLIVVGLFMAALKLVAPGIFRRVFSKKAKDKSSPVPKLVYIVAFMWLLCAFSFLAGRVWAFSQQNYTTLTLKHEKYAVIQVYSDKYILGRVGPNDKIGDYLVVDTNFLTDKPLTAEKLNISKFNWSLRP